MSILHYYEYFTLLHLFSCLPSQTVRSKLGCESIVGDTDESLANIEGNDIHWQQQIWSFYQRRHSNCSGVIHPWCPEVYSKVTNFMIFPWDLRRPTGLQFLDHLFGLLLKRCAMSFPLSSRQHVKDDRKQSHCDIGWFFGYSPSAAWRWAGWVLAAIPDSAVISFQLTEVWGLCCAALLPHSLWKEVC